MKQTIRDFQGRIRGYVNTDEQGNKTVTNFYGVILGYYFVNDDTTRDFYHRIIARGDQTGMLFED